MIESDPLSDGSFAQMPPWEAWAKAVPAFSQQNITCTRCGYSWTAPCADSPWWKEHGYGS